MESFSSPGLGIEYESDTHINPILSRKKIISLLVTNRQKHILPVACSAIPKKEIERSFFY
jgi:hypothetical protein